MGHYRRDCSLIECDIGWEVHPLGWAWTNKHPVNDSSLDSAHGGHGPSVHRELCVYGEGPPSPRGPPPLRLTAVAGVSCQIQQWPVARMTLGYNNQNHPFEVLKVDNLPFLVLLGRDAPKFGTLQPYKRRQWSPRGGPRRDPVHLGHQPPVPPRSV